MPVTSAAFQRLVPTSQTKFHFAEDATEELIISTFDAAQIAMKTYAFRKSRLFRLSVTFFAALTVLLVSCKPITSSDISGVYIRASDGVSDKIILATDGSFQQTITFTDGRSWKTHGSWKFDPAYVEFDKLYNAFDLDPKPNNVHAVVTIPPELLTDMFLEVQKGKLLRNTVEPIWIKQQSEASLKP